MILNLKANYAGFLALLHQRSFLPHPHTAKFQHLNKSSQLIQHTMYCIPIIIEIQVVILQI
uniref:Uncharacterized protein n=1 Tax=Anguilla anguilla TaxID=7936 RepID=A0A0E9WXY6_ANGAN